MADAIANRRLVEAAKRQKSRPGNEQQSQNGRPEPCKPGDTDCYGKSDDPEDPKRPSDGPEGDSGEPSQDESRENSPGEADSMKPRGNEPPPSQPDSPPQPRSEEHTSELQSLMRISYAVFCLQTKQKQTLHKNT